MVRLDCIDRRWSNSKPRDYHHVFSTTPTPTTSPPTPTTPRDLVVTSPARRSLADEGDHVTYDDEGNWSRGATVERPPVYGNRYDGDDANAVLKAAVEAADERRTVKHWLKYREARAGPSVYRELVDDEDEDVDEEGGEDLVRRHHVDSSDGQVLGLYVDK